MWIDMFKNTNKIKGWTSELLSTVWDSAWVSLYFCSFAQVITKKGVFFEFYIAYPMFMGQMNAIFCEVHVSMLIFLLGTEFLLLNSWYIKKISTKSAMSIHFLDLLFFTFWWYSCDRKLFESFVHLNLSISFSRTFCIWYVT